MGKILDKIGNLFGNREVVYRDRLVEVEKIVEGPARRTVPELVPADLGDPKPDNPARYREYVARVAGFHQDVLRPKLLEMISNTHRMMEDETLVPEMDRTLKGTVYALRELMVWGDSKVAEQVSYQADPNIGQEDRPDRPPDGGPSETARLRKEVEKVLV